MNRRRVLVSSGLSLCTTLVLGCSDPYASVVSDDFSIYLADPSYTVTHMMNGELRLELLSIDASPILSLDDIISYTWGVHELEVTEAARERLSTVDLGRVFVVTALGDRMYMGAFWEPTSSVAYADVCISKGELQRDGTPVTLWSLVEAGDDDMRAKTKIRRVLEAAGKLQ